MSDEGGNAGIYTRIEASITALRVESALRLDRIEDKLDKQTATLDTKIGEVASRQDRLEVKLEGSLSVIKWLGPVGIAALLFGLLNLYGFLPAPGP